MPNEVTLTRSKCGDPWQPYATVDMDDESTWPTDLPVDIADLLRYRDIPNEKASGEYRYRIQPVTPTPS